MKMKLFLLSAVLVLATALCFYFFKADQLEHTEAYESDAEREREEQGESARFVQERLRYEFDMLKDPITGKIPNGIIQKEREFAKTLPVREYESSYIGGTLRTQANNTYFPAGPNNIGGRTRAVAYDKRYNGTTNRVIISGCVSGG